MAELKLVAALLTSESVNKLVIRLFGCQVH